MAGSNSDVEPVGFVPGPPAGLTAQVVPCAAASCGEPGAPPPHPRPRSSRGLTSPAPEILPFAIPVVRCDHPLSPTVHPTSSPFSIRGGEPDEVLVQLLARRSRVILDVIRNKRANSMPVVDRDREDAVFESIERIARSEGLDPRIVRQVLRAVIDAFTLLEVEELGPDPS